MRKIPALLFMSQTLFILQCNESQNHNTYSPESNLDEVADTGALSLSAALFYETEHYYEAANEYEKLTKLDSSHGKYYFRRAYSLVQIDSFDLAEKNYARFAKLKYREAECYFVIGTFYSRKFNDRLARKYLRKALELNPQMDKARLFLNSLEKHDNNSI